MDLLIFATYAEAAKSLEQLKAQASSTPSLWHAECCDLLICGMGAITAALTLQQTVTQKAYDRLLNLGCSAELGAYHPGALYTIACCHKVCEQLNPDPHAQQLFDQLFPPLELSPVVDLPTATLGSVDCPLHDAQLGAQWAARYQLIDMEGYALASVAKHYALALFAVKWVSDFGSSESPGLIRSQLEQCSEELWQAASRWIGKSL